MLIPLAINNTRSYVRSSFGHLTSLIVHPILGIWLRPGTPVPKGSNAAYKILIIIIIIIFPKS